MHLRENWLYRGWKYLRGFSHIFLLLLLSSCADYALQWNFVTADELQEYATRAGFPSHARAFTILTPSGCIMFSTEPKDTDELIEFWTHESRHCYEGAYH